MSPAYDHSGFEESVRRQWTDKTMNGEPHEKNPSLQDPVVQLMLRIRNLVDSSIFSEEHRQEDLDNYIESSLPGRTEPGHTNPDEDNLSLVIEDAAAWAPVTEEEEEEEAAEEKRTLEEGIQHALSTSIFDCTKNCRK